MSFAEGLERSTRQLPAIIGHLKKESEEKKLGAALSDYLTESETANAEAAPDFVGPPRAAKPGQEASDTPAGAAPRDMLKRSRGEVSRGLAGIYAKHGRPDKATTLTDRGMAADEADEARTYARGRDAKTDARLERAEDRVVEDRETAAQERARQQLERDGQRVYRALSTGDNDLANEILRTHGDELGQMIGLGPDRKVVGVDVQDGKMALRIENATTGSTGPMTENGSADGTDRVMTIPLSSFGQMVGISEGRYGEPEVINGALMQRGSDGKMEVLLKPEDLRGSGIGRGGPVDSVEFDRVMKATGGAVKDVYRTQLGEQFMGDPEMAQAQGFASASSYVVSELAYREGLEFNPNLIGTEAARLSLTPEFAALRLSEATSIAEKEKDALGRGERGKFDVEKRANEIRDETARRLTESVAQIALENPQQFMGEQAAPAQQGGQAPAAPGAAPAQPGAQAAPGLAGVKPSAPDAAPPLPQGPSLADRTRAQVESPARRAGQAIGQTVGELLAKAEQALAPVLGERGKPWTLRGAANVLNPASQLESVGAVMRDVGEFAGGMAGETPPDPAAAQQFFDTVNGGGDPTPEQIQAAVAFDNANPGVMTEEELTVLEYYVQAIAGGAR